MEITQRIRLGLVKIPGVGPKTARNVRDACGGWRETVDVARAQGAAVPEKFREGFSKAIERGAEVARACERSGVRPMFRGEPDWPPQLAGLGDEPEVLFVRGNRRGLGERGVAVVGTRECSAAGSDMAFAMGQRLAAEGWTVVSGLARGIDTAAHRGALASEGETIAVLGCGPDVAYPSENRALLDRVVAEGTVVSEFPPGTGPRPGHFPRRNRILAALAEAVLVVESRMRGGALVTVRHALDQGKDVYVVPGWPGAPLSEGPLAMLRDGARAVRGPDDLIEDLGGTRGGPLPDPAEIRTLDAVRQGASTATALARALRVAPGEARDRLARLELLGLYAPPDPRHG